MTRDFIAFDDIRDIVARIFRDTELPDGAPNIYVVRDMYGRVGVSVSDKYKSDTCLRKALQTLGQSLHDAAGAHSRSFKKPVLWARPDLINTLKNAAQDISPRVKLADRLLLGESWWSVGPEESGSPTRYTLYSVKGGVGRSTTAAVLAWHLAEKGEDVLAIDLDIESPGLASTLLEPKVQPEFGVADWFVEELVGQGDRLVEQITATPAWTRDLSGTVWIAPAHGYNPGEYLAKLGRVYMDTASDPWTARLQRLLKQLESSLNPTVTIIESRSGLHDIAAATVTDIGAEVMLFAVDSQASWTGYEILFSHWKRHRLAPLIQERLLMISALTPELGTERYVARFRERSWDLFRDHLYNSLAHNSTSPDSMDYRFEDDNAPHAPFTINWNRGLAAGSSLRNLEESSVNQAYWQFLERFDERHRAHSGTKVPVQPVRVKPITIVVEVGRPVGTKIPSAGRNKNPFIADAESVRLALTELPKGTSHGAAPRPTQLYLPPSHRKALDPNVSLVTGGRGTGKTFWWSALQDQSILRLLSKLHPRLAPIAKSDWLTGFGVTEQPERYPTKDEISEIIAEGIEPRKMWRTIQSFHLATDHHRLKQLDSWAQRAKYVDKNSAAITRLLRDCDDRLNGEGRYSIFMFDALDRSSDDRKIGSQLIRGLLQHALEMRSFHRLRAKVFLRSDHAADPSITDFPDASKVLATEVQLTWPKRVLYGLLWHYLANGSQGALLRRTLTDGDWQNVGQSSDEPIYAVPLTLTSDEQSQRDLFHSVIAGPWMGTDHRRGFPYTWIPNHLADAVGVVSPRSFIAALKAAAHDTADSHPDHEYALHFKSLKRGVREASEIRVREIQEDYPWVDRFLKPLSGVVVPCAFEEIGNIWDSEDLISRLSDEVARNEVKLPPRNLERGPVGIRQNLEDLGIFRRRKDQRIDIPDVYRVGFGIGRKGGVTPVR